MTLPAVPDVVWLTRDHGGHGQVRDWLGLFLRGVPQFSHNASHSGSVAREHTSRIRSSSRAHAARLDQVTRHWRRETARL
jgi:hypothetical protein